MVNKFSKIRNLVLASFIFFVAIILLLLFFMQTISLDKYYEVYKTKQLSSIVDKIRKENNINTEYLEDIAYDNGICISVVEDGNNTPVSTIYNKGCIFSDKKSSYNYMDKFIKSNQAEETYLLENTRYNNKTLIKALKYNDNTYIFLNTSIEPLDSSITLIRSQYGYILIILFLISVLIALYLSDKISKPITELSNSAKKLAKGKFDTTFETTSEIEEIKDLSNALELAKDELSKTDELRKDLMANVGHDLRTPLTMIKAYAEMSRDLETQTEEKRKENMSIIIEETDRLNVLVSDILDLSKLQSNTYELKIEEFDLIDLIKNIIKRYYILIDSEEYIFEFNNKQKEIIVSADKKRIEQVIYNLINNAVNYTGKNKKVYINVIENKNTVRVEIKDTGKGLEKEEIDKIWDKYYHNEKKHKRNAFGTGLGLSIVKTILETHGYKYGVNSIKGKGTTFYFEINKSK